MVQKIVKTDQWIEPAANFDYLNLRNNFYINFKKLFLTVNIFQIQNAIKKVTSWNGVENESKDQKKENWRKSFFKIVEKTKSKTETKWKRISKKKTRIIEKIEQVKKLEKDEKDTNRLSQYFGSGRQGSTWDERREKIKVGSWPNTWPNNHKILGKEFLKRERKKQMKKNC